MRIYIANFESTLNTQLLSAYIISTHADLVKSLALSPPRCPLKLATRSTVTVTFAPLPNLFIREACL